MTISKQTIKTAFAKSVNAVLVLSGIGLVSFGAWQVYEPSAYIVAGLALFWIGLPERG